MSFLLVALLGFTSQSTMHVSVVVVDPAPPSMVTYHVTVYEGKEYRVQTIWY